MKPKPKKVKIWRHNVRSFPTEEAKPIPESLSGSSPPETNVEGNAKNNSKLGSAFYKTVYDYCEETTVQGVTYLHKKRALRENIFWAIIILVFLFLCIHFALNQYARWQYAPVIISFSDKPTSVSQIPFPALTICSETKSNKSGDLDFEKFYNSLKQQGGNVIKKPDWLTDKGYLQMRALLHVCGNYLVRGMKFPEHPPLNIIDQLKEIAVPFNENFLFCVFNRTKSNCTPLFDRIYTSEGICYSFNAFNVTELYREDTFQYKYFLTDSHIRKRYRSLDWTIDKGYEDPDNYDTYPRRSIGSGLNTGMKIVLQEFESFLDPVCRQPVQGFKVILHPPDIIPNVGRDFLHIPYERDVLISVTPHFVFTTEIVSRYTPKDRKCYLPNERPLKFFKFYTQSSCEIECLTNYTLELCNCVQFAMPRLVDTLVCGESKISCYQEAEDSFLLNEYTRLGNDERRCNCLPGCYILRYVSEVSHGVLHMNKLRDAMKEVGNTTPSGANISRLRVLYKTNEFLAWKRLEVYGYGEFMASCGGLFGLFLGISVLSVVELFYHFTVRFYINFKEQTTSE